MQQLRTNSFDVTTIVNSGRPDDESIVIIIMGDGYTSAQQGSFPTTEGTFLHSACSATFALMDTYPFNLFSHLFTVYAIHTISNESGITGMTSGFQADTYFQAFWTDNSDDGISMPSDRQVQARSLALEQSSSVAMIQIIANADKHGGVSFWGAYDYSLSVRLALTATLQSNSGPWLPAWNGTFVHEFGHSFGTLLDEHNTSVGRNENRANATQTSNPSTIKWSHWIGYEGITIRNIGSGWNVPAIDGSTTPNDSCDGCIMRASWSSLHFCAVCATELTRRLAYLSDEMFEGRSPRTNDAMPTNTYIAPPSGTTRILPYAFNGNTALQNIQIPASVTTIGDYAFIGATGLMTITNLRSIPQSINDTVFAGINRANVQVIIPPGTRNAYLNEGWTGFNLIEEVVLLTNALSSNSAEIIGTTGLLTGSFEIPSIINGKTVVKISSNAFANQTLSTEFIIPNSVTSIGFGAFSGCNSLTKISAPFVGATLNSAINTSYFGYIFGANEVTSQNNSIPPTLKTITITGGSIIDTFAFYNCNSITSVSISSTITSIGSRAFAYCVDLKKVEVLRSESLGITTLSNDSPFLGCSTLSTICVPDSTYKTATNWLTYSNLIFLINGTQGLAYTLINNGAAYSVSKGTATVGIVIIPDMYLDLPVTAINDNGFSGYSNLESITISSRIASIGSYAFNNCNQLTSIVIPNGIMSIGSYAFYGCANLSSVSIPNSTMTIGNYAFYGCSILGNITIPIAITSIGSNAFQNCTNLKVVTINKPSISGIITLGVNAFSGSTVLNAIYTTDVASRDAYRVATNWINYSSIIFADNGTLGLSYMLINDGTAYSVGRGYATAINVIIPESYNGRLITAISEQGFYDYTTLESIIIPNSVITIDEGAFAGCIGLTSVTVPTSVVNIGKEAFAGCSALTSVSIPSGVLSVPYGLFAGCTALTSVILPSSITSIGSGAFWDCRALTNITSPSSVINIDSAAFYGCSSLRSFTIPNGVTAILDFTFYGCSALTNITIPNAVTNIGSNAFYNCSNLTSVILPSNLTSISTTTFSDCTRLASINIPNTVTSIGASAFYNCAALGTLTIRANLTSIAQTAFANCTNLSIIWYYNAILDTVGIRQFVSLAYLPSGITSIPANAFAYFSKITNLSIPNTVTSIGTKAFYACSNLGITWNYNAALTTANFGGCLKTVIFPSGTTTISASAFSNSTKITSITIPSSITNIGNSAFSGCTGLTRLTIPTTVTTMGTNVFVNCSNLILYTTLQTKPNGWQSSWNGSRPAYFRPTNATPTIMSGFGYNGSTYYWNGKVAMTLLNPNISYVDTATNIYAFTGNTTLNFNSSTVNSKNAFSKITGTLSFTLNGSSVNTSSVSVSITNSVSISNGSFSINTTNLSNGTYTLTMVSSFNRASWSGSSTHTFTFIVDK